MNCVRVEKEEDQNSKTKRGEEINKQPAVNDHVIGAGVETCLGVVLSNFGPS